MGLGHVDKHRRSIQVHHSTSGAGYTRGARRDLDQLILARNDKGVHHSLPPRVCGVLHTGVPIRGIFVKHPGLHLLYGVLAPNPQGLLHE